MDPRLYGDMPDEYSDEDNPDPRYFDIAHWEDKMARKTHHIQ